MQSWQPTKKPRLFFKTQKVCKFSLPTKSSFWLFIVSIVSSVKIPPNSSPESDILVGVLLLLLFLLLKIEYEKCHDEEEEKESSRDLVKGGSLSQEADKGRPKNAP